jgi:hypothetical protein
VRVAAWSLITFAVAQWVAARVAVAQTQQPGGPTSAPMLDSLAGTAPLQARLSRLLVVDGFANVVVMVETERVVAAYENARYRDPRRALERVAELLLPEISDDQELVLVPTVTAIPILSARYARRSLPDEAPSPGPAMVSLDVSRLPPNLLRVPRASSSFGRLDLVVHPWFEASFGAYDNPVASRTGIAPELRIALRPGLTLSAQALLTIQDDIPTGESRVRPGLVVVDQTVRLPRNVFVSASAGAFTRDRYGVDVETAAYSANGRWSVGADLGLTGTSSFASLDWSFSPVGDPTALVTVAGRIPRYDLTVRTTAGVFLGDERGGRIDVVRRFGEFEIGWFGVASGGGANGGVTLRVPLPQRRYAVPRPLRIRAAEWFRLQYRYRGLASGGRSFDTGTSLGVFPWDFFSTP